MLPRTDDTIVAVATPPGRGAIAVLRLSGHDAYLIAARVVVPWPDRARQVTLAEVRDPDTNELIDQVLVTRFDTGRSYTGQPLVELSTHGGFAAPAAVLRTLIHAGAREARPGEFTRRAVLNGKLDLMQAEAIGDLVEARSDALRRVAIAMVDGNLSRRISELRSVLLDAEALLAYEIDFPEEDDGPLPQERILVAIEVVRSALDALVATAPSGALIKEGARVVIAGKPNAGKSSLFNALLGEGRAIVTDVPGTTRDSLEAVVDTARWPLRLIDTAGLRKSSDRVEQLGVEMSERQLAGAHVVLVCGDSLQDINDTLASVRAHTKAPGVAVLTKADLITNVRHSATDLVTGAVAVVAVSAVTGEGLHALLSAVNAVLDTEYGAPIAEFPVLVRTRHQTSLRHAHDEVVLFRDAWQVRGIPASVAAVHLRSAVLALDELIGAVDTEDVLDRLFSTFCIGK